jgi:squalene-hopene/tetraprenyl-beta-curcumene cyclase
MEQAAPDQAVEPERVRSAVHAATERLRARQHPEGYWCAELEGDSILQSEYILMKWILGHEDDERLPRIANHLRGQQGEDGAWIQYPGGAMDLSATVKGYYALKLQGDDPEAPHMRAARERIRAAGGAERINSFSKFYLAGLGQIGYSALPSIPPEIVYLPKGFYFHLDKISAWTRTMILPLSVVTTYRIRRSLPQEQGIDELYLDEKRRHKLVPGQDRPHPFWSRFFLVVDKLLKGVDALGMPPWRRKALRWIEDWLLRRLEGSDGLGAIFPPMVYIQIAFRGLGYADDHPVLEKARRDLDELMLEDEQTQRIRIQPCFSPVWDTGIAAYALSDAGLDASDDTAGACAAWLVSKECREPGDWIRNVEQAVTPSGWFFEFHNPWYPDVDDTAMVSMALKRIGGPEAEAAAERGVQWIRAMQNDDGGWAAFDRTKPRPILDQVPFGDHNAMQDPSCPDITGRVLECLGQHGIRIGHDRAVDAAAIYLQRTQDADGSWSGRWGVNHIYGTWQAVCGLPHVGVSTEEAWVQRAGDWLKSHQKEDGSFGESPDSYEDERTKGEGPATASQTAWAMMAMQAIFGPRDPAVERAAAWLLATQQEDGNWEETWFTGTGFPRVFYLRYHLYRLYFPLMALGRWLRAREGSENA